MTERKYIVIYDRLSQNFVDVGTSVSSEEWMAYAKTVKSSIEANEGKIRSRQDWLLYKNLFGEYKAKALMNFFVHEFSKEECLRHFGSKREKLEAKVNSCTETISRIEQHGD